MTISIIFISMLLPICIGNQVEEEEMTQWMGLLMEELDRCPWAGDWFAVVVVVAVLLVYL